MEEVAVAEQIEITESGKPLPIASALAEEQPVRGFRVRMIRFDRPESKMLIVRAKSERSARTQAQQRAGREWRVARIQAIED